MTTLHSHSAHKVLSQPEIIGLILEKLSKVDDLLNCACVNSTWNSEALRHLYRGSLNNMQFRSPDIGSLNCLLVADRNRFTENMRFAKHLLISTNSPGMDKRRLPSTQLVSLDKCRALRSVDDARRLFQPDRRTISSILIPFEITGQHWALTAEGLLADSVKFLAIDIAHCRVLITWKPFLYDLKPKPGLRYLQALTIYYDSSPGEEHFEELCDAIADCRLQFLHLENQNNVRQPVEPILNTTLISCIKKQVNLTTLALRSMHCHISDPDTDKDSNYSNAWPSLKALYIRYCKRAHFRKLATFKNIEIIIFEMPQRKNRISLSMINNVIMCKHLKILDLRDYEIDDLDLALKLTATCTQLIKLCLGLAPRIELTEYTFEDLVRGLPHLQILMLDWECQMGISVFQDLAFYCPSLIFLNLPQSRICLSLRELKWTTPLLKLKSMNICSICFESPYHLRKPEMFEELVSSWRKVFPRLCIVPCPGDDDSYYWHKDMEVGHILTQEEDDKMPYPRLGSNFIEYNSSWQILRVILWKTLDYESDPLHHERLQNLWQSNIETEILGWPVIPFQAFINPELYST